MALLQSQIRIGNFKKGKEAKPKSDEKSEPEKKPKSPKAKR